MPRKTTLCLLIRGDEILLGMKKRRFGVGKWNGFGGKIDEEKGDKNILDALSREVKEEADVEIKNPEQVGLMRFKFPYKPEWDQDVHLYLVKEWTGEPKESEEMLPKWFKFSEIPYDKMWDDDKFWLPLVLENKKIEADFSFKEGEIIDKHIINIVDSWT
jgi:ADP-ribose pyrophosphatase YjhB (NUDIX family)